MPSLRSFNGYAIEVYEINKDEDGYVPIAKDTQRTSFVETVELTWSAISPERLFEFIRPMAHLKELSYEHGGASVGGPPGKDIEEYGDELEEAAR